MGVVHDENIKLLKGIYVNTEVFSAINDLLNFIQTLLNEDTSILSKDMHYKLSHNLTKDLNLPKALGFILPNSIYDKFIIKEDSNK